MNYEQWCKKNTNMFPLVRALKSSMPEQYIGFYLQNQLSEEIEYQKQFSWLGNHSLDIYIPSLHLGIEYDVVYYHSSRKGNDDYKILLPDSVAAIFSQLNPSDYPEMELSNRVFHMQLVREEKP